MARASHLAAVLLGLAAVAAAPSALAQDPSSLPASGTSGAATPSFGTLEKRPYWEAGKPRAFVSSVLELGIFYYRPTLAIGYGEPHWQWVGVETQARLTAGSGSEYLGVRAAWPHFDVRLGARYQISANQSYLEREETYDDEMLEFDEAPSSRYATLEGEVGGSIPVGDGAIIGLASVHYILGVPSKYDVFEDQLNVAVEPPWVWRGRTGYIHAFGVDRGLRIGAAIELVGNPERELLVFRVGPQIGVSLTHHLQAGFSIMAAVVSKDDLDLEGTEISQFGFQYRWATGDPFPEFP